MITPVEIWAIKLVCFAVVIYPEYEISLKDAVRTETWTLVMLRSPSTKNASTKINVVVP